MLHTPLTKGTGFCDLTGSRNEILQEFFASHQPSVEQLELLPSALGAPPPKVC
jgi:hypothetical protein